MADGAAEEIRNAVEPAATAGVEWRPLVRHARYYWLLLAESHLTRRLF